MVADYRPIHLMCSQVTSRQAHVNASEKMLALERSKMADLQKGISELKVRALMLVRPSAALAMSSFCSHAFLQHTSIGYMT